MRCHALGSLSCLGLLGVILLVFAHNASGQLAPSITQPTPTPKRRLHHDHWKRQDEDNAEGDSDSESTTETGSDQSSAGDSDSDDSDSSTNDDPTTTSSEEDEGDGDSEEKPTPSPDNGGDDEDADPSYSSTTTVIVTSTRKGDSGGGGDSNSGSSGGGGGNDDDDDGSTSQTAWIIAGSGVGALALIGGIFYFATKDKDLNWMDLLTANRNQENGQDMSQMNGPPGPMGGGGASSFGGPVPPPPPADPFGGAQGAPMGGIPPENPFEPTFNNQPVPQGGSFAPQFPQMQDFGPPPPVPPMSMGSKRSRSAGSSSSSSSSSRSGKRRGGGGYEMSAFSANTSDAYDPTVHHDRPTSPDKSQFIQSQGPAGYAVTSVSRMYDSDGNLLNRPKYAATLTGPNGSIREVSDNASGYGMMRGGSRAGTQASGSYFSRRHSGVSGASFRSGGSKGTGISASSFGQKSDALTSISRRNPRGGDGSSSYTGRSFSSSKLAPRSYGRTAPLSLKSSRYGGSRKGSNRGFDDESAFSRDTDGSGGSSGLTSRTAGTKWEASTAKGSTKYSAFSSGTMRSKSSGLKMSNSDLGASQSGLTSSAFGRAKRFREYEDDDDSEVLMGGGPSTSAGRSYVQGGSSAFGGGTSALGGKGLKLAQSDLLYGGSSLNGSSARKLFTT